MNPQTNTDLPQRAPFERDAVGALALSQPKAEFADPSLAAIADYRCIHADLLKAERQYRALDVGTKSIDAKRDKNFGKIFKQYSHMIDR